MKTFAKFILIPAVILAFWSPGCALSEQFSMQIQSKPLSDVFQDLAELSGNDIVFDKAWGDRPITVRFVNLPLEKAISKILTNLNHVVIFEDSNIRIKIYGPVSPDKSTGPIPVGSRTPMKPRPTEGSGPRHRLYLLPPGRIRMRTNPQRKNGTGSRGN